MMLVPAIATLALMLFWSASLTAADLARRLQQGRGQRITDTQRGGLALARLTLHTIVISLSVVLGERAWNTYGAAAGAVLAWLAITLLATAVPHALARRHGDRLSSQGALLWLPVRLLTPVAQWLLRPMPNGRSQNSTAAQPQPSAHDTHDSEARASRQGVSNGILGLDRMTVNDILVPRHEIDGIDLDEPLERIMDQLMVSRHTRLPLFRGDINQMDKVVNTRQISHLLPSRALTEEALLGACYEAYFVPEGTPLPTQLLNFHKQQRRLGIVVDEYGEVLGLVTLEDILEEIVGEFENEAVGSHPHVFPQADGRYILDGAASLRDLNKVLGWHLPSDGPKTLNGLVTEALESIPERAVCLKIGPYRMEILETDENRVKRLLAWQHTVTPPSA